MTGTAERIVARFANATVTAGSLTARAIYDAPSSNVTLYDGSVTTTDPHITILQADVDRLTITNGSAVTVTPDGGAAINYLIRDRQGDGAGIVVCPLTLSYP